jgi:hypothetical protein
LEPQASNASKYVNDKKIAKRIACREKRQSNQSYQFLTIPA